MFGSYSELDCECDKHRGRHSKSMNKFRMIWSVASILCDLLAISTFSYGAVVWSQNTTVPRSGTSKVAYHILPGFGNPESAWDCSRPILVAVNATQVSSNDRDSVLRDLNATLKEISSRTPFTFVNIGPTTAIPTWRWLADAATSSGGPDAVIFFGSASQTDLMTVDDAGVGGAYQITDLDGNFHLRGAVVINLLQFFDSFQSGSGYFSRQTLFTHELLHVLGLDHNERPDSVMTSRISNSYGRLGSGDIEGLAHQGRIGCGY